MSIPTSKTNENNSASVIAHPPIPIWRFPVSLALLLCTLLLGAPQAWALAAYSIWGDSFTPTIPATADPNPLVLGVKLKSQVSGYITGIRFYKGSNNTGSHVGKLWTGGGAELASVTFAGETADGWQQQMFASPVAISANTTYVASYHSPSGAFSLDAGYFSGGGRTNAPLIALGDGVDGGNGVFASGGPELFPSTTVNAGNYWVDVVFVENVGPDTNAPTVVAVSPLDGAVGVSRGTTVAVTFNEAMDAATIANGITLNGSGVGLVASTVAYDAATLTATLTPNSLLALSTVYTVAVANGTTGVKDVAGNALTAMFTASFTTTGQEANSYSIWGDSFTPTIPAAADPNALVLGVKFQSQVSGSITGLRFYKGENNTGPHVGKLWTSGGAALASVTFANETASGWQQQMFASPVPISANTTYVASYHSPSGAFSFDPGYFSGGGHTNAPLVALGDGVDGGNGVFASGGPELFPSTTVNAANYWVDVVMVLAQEVDTNAPTVVAVSPLAGAVDVSRGTAVAVTFSEAMNPATIAGGITLSSSGGGLVASAVAFDAATFTATLTPNSLLALSTVYTVLVANGATGVKDVAGNALAVAFTASFTTTDVAPDTNAPVIVCPADVILQGVDCNCNTDPSNTGMATASDDNGSVTVTHSDLVSGVCPKIVKRTWTATDGAGNTASCVQTITCKEEECGVFLLIDADCIDNTTPGYSLPPNTGYKQDFERRGRTFTDRDVNDDRPGLAQRAPLRFFNNPTNFGQVIVLRSGQIGDEGLFALREYPNSWNKVGPTTNGLLNFMGQPCAPFPHMVGPGLGTGNDPEAYLDKIPNVTPLGAPAFSKLVGKIICGLVWDSDISINYKPLNGSLKGEKLGVVAFRLLEVKQAIGFSSSTLPLLTIQIVDPCEAFKCVPRLFVESDTPPSLTCPSGMLLEFQDEKGAVGTYSVTATGGCSPITVVSTPPSGSLFPIGVTPVHVQALDACGNSNQCTFDVTVLGARGVKSNILAELVAVRDASSERMDSWHLNEAIEDMIDALGLDVAGAPHWVQRAHRVWHCWQHHRHPGLPLWLDETHVDRRNGSWVFFHEKNAVKELVEIMQYKKSRIPEALVRNWIERLVRVDRLLAVVSIQDAARAGLSPKKLDKAIKAVAKGDRDAAKDKPDRAIENYQDAWDEAVHLKVNGVMSQGQNIVNQALNSVNASASRQMQLEFLGAVKQVYAIEASTNLVDWVKVGTCTADAEGNVKYADPDTSKHPSRYYRVVPQ